MAGTAEGSDEAPGVGKGLPEGGLSDSALRMSRSSPGEWTE